MTYFIQGWIGGTVGIELDGVVKLISPSGRDLQGVQHSEEICKTIAVHARKDGVHGWEKWLENKTMRQLAESLMVASDYEPIKCLICGAVHPDITPITGPDAWTITQHKILGYANLCPDCSKN